MRQDLLEPIVTPQLPPPTMADRWNAFQNFAKFRLIPGHGYYHYRAWKYLRRKQPELGLIRYLADSEKISLDIGANLGLVTYFLARASKYVYAFEPNPFPYETLKHLVDDNVSLHFMAVSDYTGEAELTIPRSSRGWSSNGASLAHEAAGSAIKVKVPCRKIDDIGFDDVGFIKVDVEGHERAVLRGCRQTIERCRPVLMIENEYSHVGDRFMDTFEVVKDLDYEGFFVINGRLCHMSLFDLKKHQLETDRGGKHTLDYVRNFIFVPRKSREMVAP